MFLIPNNLPGSEKNFWNFVFVFLLLNKYKIIITITAFR